MRKHRILDRVAGALRAEGIEVAVFDGVSPDPRSDEIEAALDLCRAGACDFVVGLGGGSALDAAKAASVAIVLPSVAEAIGATLEHRDGTLPMLAIPTTAGSGAEVTKGAIVTDAARGFKSGIRGPDVYPDIALVDPALTATMPFEVAAETGFDALTHAVETYVARRASPLTEILSERALRLLGPALAQLGSGRLDDELRATLSLAALYGGLTVAAASTCLPHRLQQATASVPEFHLSHGRGLAALYPAWLRAAYPYAPDRFDRVAELLGCEDAATAGEEAIEELGLGGGLTAHGFPADGIERCLDGVSGNVDNDPIDAIDRDLMRRIYTESL
jgi:alcohol dehydrogenase